MQHARDQTSGSGIQTILAAMDCVPDGEAVLETAKHLAKAVGAKIRLIHANDLGVEASAPAADYEEMLREHRANANATLARRLEELECQGIEVETVVIDGIPTDVILEEAKDADLLVMGKHWRSKWRLFSRNTVEAVLAAAPCPVVIASGNPKKETHQARSGWQEQAKHS